MTDYLLPPLLISLGLNKKPQRSDIIKIYVGCAPNGEDAESLAVLVWTIKKYTTPPYIVSPMHISETAEAFSGWDTSNWPTPFSGFRWAVPEINQFSGIAIYTDSDVMFRDDLRKLWAQQIPPKKAILCKSPNRLCVSLWDCGLAKPYMMALKRLKTKSNNHGLMVSRMGHSNITSKFDGDWDCLDGEPYKSLEYPEIKAIHYTHMRHQPHLSLATARLAKYGRRHWFDGDFQRHWRADVTTMFLYLLDEAERNGVTVNDFFDPTKPEIKYKKRSVAGIGQPKHRR